MCQVHIGWNLQKNIIVNRKLSSLHESCLTEKDHSVTFEQHKEIHVMTTGLASNKTKAVNLV